MQERAEEQGYRVVTATSSRDLAVGTSVEALRALISLQVDGLVIAAANVPSEQIVPYLERVPIVIAGRKESHPSITSVYCDDVDGGTQLARHLLLQGHRRIAVALVDKAYSLSQHARGEAMIQTINEAGAEAVIHRIPNDGATAGMVDSVLFDPAITALMCPTDTSMLDVLEVLRIRGKSAPEDLSVTGYDGVPPLSAAFLGLATYHQPVREIGHEAIDCLLRAIEEQDEPGQHVQIKGYVVPGRTTRGVMAPSQAR
jgi:DNA-binding LacI/PurR family transcriptional regulator